SAGSVSSIPCAARARPARLRRWLCFSRPMPRRMSTVRPLPSTAACRRRFRSSCIVIEGRRRTPRTAGGNRRTRILRLSFVVGAGISCQRSTAVVARELGLPVSVEQIKVQSPRHGEVMIRLAACGVCHSDLSATNGTIAYPLPLVLGHEGAGIVTAVGEGVSRYAIGDHVVSSFVSICGRCHYCQTGRPHLCVQSLQALYTLP